MWHKLWSDTTFLQKACRKTIALQTLLFPLYQSWWCESDKTLRPWWTDICDVFVRWSFKHLFLTWSYSVILVTLKVFWYLTSISSLWFLKKQCVTSAIHCTISFGWIYVKFWSIWDELLPYCIELKNAYKLSSILTRKQYFDLLYKSRIHSEEGFKPYH